jgi:hypothetical protein
MDLQKLVHAAGSERFYFKYHVAGLVPIQVASTGTLSVVLSAAAKLPPVVNLTPPVGRMVILRPFQHPLILDIPVAPLTFTVGYTPGSIVVAAVSAGIWSSIPKLFMMTLLIASPVGCVGWPEIAAVTHP